jgi:hypothetical protein
MQSTKTKIESYPAPTKLATKTDLSPQEVKAITEAVNPLIADGFALYVKTKNFHWLPVPSYYVGTAGHVCAEVRSISATYETCQIFLLYLCSENILECSRIRPCRYHHPVL